MVFFNIEPTEFQFIDPDREPMEHKNIDQVFHLAQIIVSTGLTYYIVVQIKSGLNLHAWEQYLHEYPD